MKRVVVSIGVVVMAAGGIGFLRDVDRTRPTSSLVFFIGAALVHDLVWAPALLVLGSLLRRRLTPRWRAPVAFAAAASAAIALVTFPTVRSYGRAADNPSLLPGDYGRSLVLVIGVVWIAALAWGGWRRAHLSATTEEQL